MNAIARELENPFGPGANRVCVPEFHARFFFVVRDASRSFHNPPRPPRPAGAGNRMTQTASSDAFLGTLCSGSYINIPSSPKEVEKEDKLQQRPSLPTPPVGGRGVSTIAGRGDMEALFQRLAVASERVEQHLSVISIQVSQISLSGRSSTLHHGDPDANVKDEAPSSLSSRHVASACQRRPSSDSGVRSHKG